MVSPTIELLENCKGCLRRTYDVYMSSSEEWNDFNIFLDDGGFRKARTIIFKLCERKAVEKPQRLINLRSVEEFILSLRYSGVSSYNENLSYISTLFNSFMK